MDVPIKQLADDSNRRSAMAVHDRSILVEAGAGSGKTAIMAGRIAMMLAEGIEPKTIAAVTFTELAASELIIRVREFVSELTAWRIPPELLISFPNGLSNDQHRDLIAASSYIDEITCSTIHGFCQRLIKPYPVEADIDPGATVMDRNQADLFFVEVIDAWLRDILAGETGGLIAELVQQDPDKTVELIRKILSHLRTWRACTVDDIAQLPQLVAGFKQAVQAFSSFMRSSSAHETETAEIVACFEQMAEAVTSPQDCESPADLVRLLLTPRNPDLCTAAGGFRAYRKKGKWADAAKRAGLGKADGDRLNLAAETHYAACQDAWIALKQVLASRVLTDLIGLVQPAIQRFRDFKRSASLLDFDDLIFAARDLLCNHDPVRRALAARFAHVLVDEFQDTDPLQIEIFWRLCGERPSDAPTDEWKAYRIRPGALFLVGDPKQAIYRFRGADVVAYIGARDAFLAQDCDSVLPISTNFRSCAPILQYVNERFENILSQENGQPGFTALDPFHPERDGGACVAALDIMVANEEGKATAEEQRDKEAEAVAEMCARLIGSELVLDRKTGERRACRPGDIALLAPTGRDLWRYEEALEKRSIPIATQAGKGLFRRQEIQDLIAITRVLTDRRDTLALGALLRGPLVGLTEEELLDIVWVLPRAEGTPNYIPRLDLGVDQNAITHPHARDIVGKLQSLRRLAGTTTPHNLLSQAIDVLRVRPILIARHHGQAERALANVDLYLSLSRSYSVRGLSAFAEAMTAAWTDEARAVEGRPDAQEEAVSLYSMHAAKGLEWLIVVPINTMTGIMDAESAVTDRATGRFYCPVFGEEPEGYEAAHAAEKAELNRERIRLWYVATTRARELLVIPRLDVASRRSSWNSLLDLSLAQLPAMDLGNLPPETGIAVSESQNSQTREIFAAEAAAIDQRARRIAWLAPNRAEDLATPVLLEEKKAILMSDVDGAQLDGIDLKAVLGSRERGLIIHKLIEEVLTGETEETMPALTARAGVLVQAMGRPVANDPALGLAPAELAGCVVRVFELPEIVALRPCLKPEFPVYASTATGAQELVTAGVVDAIAFGPEGAPTVIVDWKSDVDPSAETIEHYRAQVRAYLDMTEAERGLVVLATRGAVIPVSRSGPYQ